MTKMVLFDLIFLWCSSYFIFNHYDGDIQFNDDDDIRYYDCGDGILFYDDDDNIQFYDVDWYFISWWLW